MLYQYRYTLSPRQSHQLKWSRFVNTHGQIGKNIECDLHNYGTHEPTMQEFYQKYGCK